LVDRWSQALSQDFLTRAGISTTVDGRFGPRTRKKLGEWERRAHASSAGAGLRIDGRMPPAEAARLRREVEQVEAGRSPAPAPALLAAPAEAGRHSRGSRVRSSAGQADHRRGQRDP